MVVVIWPEDIALSRAVESRFIVRAATAATDEKQAGGRLPEVARSPRKASFQFSQFVFRGIKTLLCRARVAIACGGRIGLKRFV
jgi:hypothetical protein